MNFTINVDIDIDEISQKVATKVEKEAYAIVEAKAKKQIDRIMQESLPLDEKLKEYAEQRVQSYVDKLVDELFNVQYYWRDQRDEKLKEYLGDHLADKAKNILDGVEFDSEKLETRIVNAVAEHLTRQTRMTKPVVKRLAEEIVNIQEARRSK